MKKYSLLFLSFLFFACAKGPVTVDVASDAKVLFNQAGLNKGTECMVRMTFWDGSEKTSVYTAGEGLTLEGGDLQYNSTEGASFIAYAPSGASVENGFLTFSVTADQSVGLKPNDLLTSFASIRKATIAPVALAFSHRLADVEIIFRDINISKVVFNGLVTGAVWNLNTNSIALKDESAMENVIMYREGNIFRAIVPAQTIPAGSELIVTDIDRNEYSYAFDTEIRLSEGKRMSLQIGKSFSGGSLESIYCETDAPWHDENGIDSWI